MENHQITFATGCSGIGAPEMAWHDRLGRGIAEEFANPAPFEIHYPEQQTFNF